MADDEVFKRRTAMSADADVANEILQYLREGKETRESNSEKLDQITILAQKTNLEMQLHLQRDEMAHNEFRNSLNGLASRVDALEKDGEDTSKHNLVALQEQLKERDRAKKEQDRLAYDNVIWYKRWGVQTIGGAILGLIIMYIASKLGLKVK